MEENIDWAIVKKRRQVKIISVPQSAIESYILISKLPDTSVVNTWDLPEDWIVGGVTYNMIRGSFLFLVLSPDFDPVPEGSEIEPLVERKHFVELIRGKVVR